MAFWITVIALFLMLLLIAAHLWTRHLAGMAEAALPPQGKRQAVTGGTLHFVESGDPGAPPVLLIHGLGGVLQHFTYALTDPLSRDFHVVALDRPGCGWSSRAPGHDGLRAQAAMIAEFIEARGLDRPVVVGHSLGGAVALALALDHPDKVGALALICPLTQKVRNAPDVFKGLEVRNPTLRALIGNTIAAPMAKRTTDAALTAVFKPEPWPQDFPLRAGGFLGLRPQAYITASEDLVAAEAGMPALSGRYAAELKVPGGVLYGDQDNILSPEKHGPPMEALGFDYETLEGKGHMIPLTEPDKTADFIARMAAKRAA